MKLELGKIKIDDIQFAEKTYVKDHVSIRKKWKSLFWKTTN